MAIGMNGVSHEDSLEDELEALLEKYEQLGLSYREIIGALYIAIMNTADKTFLLGDRG